MKVFKEMVTLVSRQRLNKIEIVDEKVPLTKDNLYLKLFKGIADGSFATDEEASLALYQSSPTDKKYLMLKSRLKDRLVNTLFFLNHKKIQDSAYQKAVYVCNRNYFCAKILITHGARTSAVAMAKSTLSVAQQFDLNEIVLLCSKMLRNHYSMMGMKNEFTRYDNLAKESLQLVKAENRAEFMYQFLLSNVARSKAYSPDIARHAKEYFTQSKELSKYKKSFHLKLLHYRIGLLYYQMIRNYRLTLQLCNSLQGFLRKNPRFYLSSGEGEIALLKMVCCLYLRDYKNGKINAEEALKFYKPSSNNWLVVLENYFLLAMHAGKYKHAAEIYKMATEHPRFQNLSAEKAEEWKINEAYINYIFPDRLHGKEFKLLRFINEVPIYSKDKKGFYPAILIIKILYLIDRGDEERVEKNIEALRVFSTRHLLNKNAPRTGIFIKMLRQLVTQHYNPEDVRARATPYLKKLKGAELNSKAETEIVEIIPYENVWSIIVSRLQNMKTDYGYFARRGKVANETVS